MMAEKKQSKNILSQGSHATEDTETDETSKTAEATDWINRLISLRIDAPKRNRFEQREISLDSVSAF